MKPTDVLTCLINKSHQIEKEMQNLCTNVEDRKQEYEKISIMIDSGASETVAPADKFGGYELKKTTATGTTYSSAAAASAAIVNKGEKRPSKHWTMRA